MRSVLRRLRGLVWHPLLFAAWPVITRYQDNIDETPVREAVQMALLSAGIALAVLVLLTLLLRNARRAGLITSIIVVTILLWGAAVDQFGEPPWLLYVWVGAAILLIAVCLRIRSILGELTTIAAGMSVVVFGLALSSILREKAPDIAAWRTPAAPAEDLDAQVGQWSAPGEPRDIFYLVFDRYGSQESMEERWDMDLSGFFDGLTQRGFVVTPDSKANHLRTAQSLASTLNLRYLDDLARRYGPNTGNMLPVYRQLQDNAVGRLLKDRGYEYVQLGPWWDPTQENPAADVNLPYESESDFELSLFRSTLLSYFERRPEGRTLSDQLRRVPYDGALHQFRSLRQVAKRPGPTFVFAHILLPHEPFVFDKYGNFITLDEDATRPRELEYAEQTTFTNRLIEAMLDDVLDVPEAQRPIMVISADEGPHPVRFKADEENFDWTTATDEELGEKLRILNAYLFPDPPKDPGLYDSISPVNSWRVIFNTYFGADLPLLEDRTYVFTDENRVYDFTDVTDRVGIP